MLILKKNKIVKLNTDNGEIFMFPEKKKFYNEYIFENINIDCNKKIVSITKNLRIHNQEDLRSDKKGIYCKSKEECVNRANEFLNKAISDAEKKYGTSYDIETTSGISVYTWEIGDNLYYRIDSYENSGTEYFCNINCTYSKFE